MNLLTRYSCAACMLGAVSPELLPAQTPRDSAGVRIVTHAAAARPQREWKIAPEPLLVIGGPDGAGPTLFSSVWGAARSEKGLIVVSDGANEELRVFDATGRHVRTFGRRGEGPGEFTQIRMVQIIRDTLYALDDGRGTAVFTLEGKLVRQRPYPSLAPYTRGIDPWGVLADGSTIEGAGARSSMEILNKVGTRIEMRGLLRIAADSRSMKVLSETPTYEFYRDASDPPGGYDVAFAPTASVAVTSDRVCTARGEQFEIRCMNADGQTQIIVRRIVTPAPVTAAARDAYLKKLRTPTRSPGHEPTPQAVLDKIASRVHFAKNFPAFDRIFPGVDNEVWVSEYRYERRILPYGEQAPSGERTRWNVFAKDGAWTGGIVLPSRFSPRQVGRDFLLGVDRDDDGVERVALYRLLR